MYKRQLSQNVKMSLDFRRLKLNGNILICGGSGAGKTFYEVKPNLMQMPHNCSFICTDPKGEIPVSYTHLGSRGKYAGGVFGRETFQSGISL